MSADSKVHNVMTAKRLAIWFALVLLLALYSRWQTDRSRGGRCDLDGSNIMQGTRVDLMVDAKVVASFCSVTCAARWPDVPAGAHWQVHDERTGVPLDAQRARFVQSRVIAVAAPGCRIHVFKDTGDALDHLRQYAGHWIANPLSVPGGPSARDSGQQIEVPVALPVLENADED